MTTSYVPGTQMALTRRHARGLVSVSGEITNLRQEVEEILKKMTSIKKR